MQMKHKKMDNMTMFPHAFIVNIEKDDSVHFNQTGGKKMRGYFKDDKLHQMFIDGNAESIYFARDSGTTKVTGMERSLSTRISVDFENNQATRIGFYLKPEHKYTPIAKVVDDDKILKGFIWKPKERPISKESIIPSYGRKAEAKAAKEKAKAGKAGDKKSPDGKAVKDTTGTGPQKLPGVKAVKDTLNKLPSKMPGVKAVADSLNKMIQKSPAIKSAKDSLLKGAPVKLPGNKAPKDSVNGKPIVKKPGE
jgi:hypothetical protein